MDTTQRVILHLDLDAFFCAVEEQRDPTLAGLPFAVGGTPEQRGVVASCSYAARMFGVHSALPMSQAVRLCPQLLIVPHHFDLYRAASHSVMAVLRELTPLVEQLSIDEAFLDVSVVADGASMAEAALSGEQIARALQRRINTELRLPCSLGVASNKLVAKCANNIGKGRNRSDRPPNAIEIVPYGTEAAYLAPLPVGDLYGVGPKTADKLNALGIETIGDLARQNEFEMKLRFGKSGYEMVLRARGIDDRPVVTEREVKSISRETTFNRDQRDAETIQRVLRELAADVAEQLRKEHLRGKTVQIKLRWTDFTTFTRQTSFSHGLDSTEDITNAAQALLSQHWTAGRPIRLLGVGVSSFEDDSTPGQLRLWE